MNYEQIEDNMECELCGNSECGRIGYAILWLMGAPAGLLFVMWLFLGNNIFGPG